MTFRIKNLHRMLTVDEKLRQLIIGKTIADIYTSTVSRCESTTEMMKKAKTTMKGMGNEEICERETRSNSW